MCLEYYSLSDDVCKKSFHVTMMSEVLIDGLNCPWHVGLIDFVQHVWAFVIVFKPLLTGQQMNCVFLHFYHFLIKGASPPMMEFECS